MIMSELKVEVDPAEVGFAADRLHRLDDNFARYVDAGLINGWLLAVSRHGKLAYVAHGGHRDKEAGLEVTPDTLWRIYSMTKPITSVATMMLYEEGRFELTDPVSKLIPAFKDVRVFTGRQRPAARHGPGDRAGAHPPPAHAHLGAHLRVPPEPSGGRHVPGGGLRARRPARRHARRSVRHLGGPAAALPAGRRVELLGRH